MFEALKCLIYAGPKETCVLQDLGFKGFIMALASKNELRPPYLIFFLNCTLKIHFLYHLASLMNKGGAASITCQLVGHMPACWDPDSTSSPCDFSFPCLLGGSRGKSRQSQGEWPIHPLLLTALAWIVQQWCCVLCVPSHSLVSDSATPWTGAHQAPLFIGILQARIPEWVAMPSSRGSSLTQGLNPHLLRWQAGSLPLRPPL